MKKLFVKNITDGSIHEVWKYMGVTESVWCDTWHGHHVIGYDCEWYNENTEVNKLLSLALHALNLIPNKKLKIDGVEDTYEIASLISKYLK
jgi:hypothetical protein